MKLSFRKEEYDENQSIFHILHKKIKQKINIKPI